MKKKPVIEIDFSSLTPQKEKDFYFVDIPKLKLGRGRKDVYYNKEDDLIFITFDGKTPIERMTKTVPPERMIIDFMLYDLYLRPYRDKEYWDNTLETLKGLAINKIVGIDFSVYYETPPPVIANNIYINLLRQEDAQKKGLLTVMNWNYIHLDYFKVYEYCLPSTIPTLFMDRNHHYDLDRELKVMSRLLDSFTVKSVVMQSAKKNLEGHQPILQVLQKHDIPYAFLPSQTVLVPNHQLFRLMKRDTVYQGKYAAKE